MERVGDAADKAAVRLAVSMGADEAQVGALVERQAEAKARKAAAQKGQPPAAQNGAPPSCPPCAPKKKGWQAPQDAKTREKALKDGCPPCAPPLERCWHCFPNLPPAGAWDWLGKDQPGVRDRPGQPIKRFLQPGPHRNFPTRVCRKIYLLPLGDVSGAPAPAVLTELLRLWFCLEVELMKPLPAKALAAIERDEDGCGYGAQIECPSAQKVIHAHKPRDAFIVIGYTMEDLCNSSSGFGFLFGEANLDLSIGLFSFARYADDVPRSSPRFLRRCGMVLCHEASHLFGIKHCVYASCVMNGSNHLEESESRPFALCPVDLRKIQLTLDQAKVNGKDTPPVDLLARQRGLVAFFDAHGLVDDARFGRGLLSALTGEPEPDPEGAEAAAAPPPEGPSPPEPPPPEPPRPLRQLSDQGLKPLVTPGDGQPDAPPRRAEPACRAGRADPAAGAAAAESRQEAAGAGLRVAAAR